jgi:lipopolysaccharide export system protein LptA
MIYTDAARTVEFRGAVRVADADGTMTAQQATVWLTGASSSNRPQMMKSSETERSAAGTAPAAQIGFMGGKLDHMIASGAVGIDQPGRKGTGEKLMYTASDGVYVLTGTRAVPPRVVDETQGTTTGAALRFTSGNGSVEVLGSEDGKTKGRVHSETRMRQQ